MGSVQLEQTGEAWMSEMLDGGEVVKHTGDYSSVYNDRLSWCRSKVEAGHWALVAWRNIHDFVLSTQEALISVKSNCTASTQT